MNKAAAAVLFLVVGTLSVYEGWNQLTGTGAQLKVAALSLVLVPIGLYSEHLLRGRSDLVRGGVTGTILTAGIVAVQLIAPSGPLLFAGIGMLCMVLQAAGKCMFRRPGGGAQPEETLGDERRW